MDVKKLSIRKDNSITEALVQLDNTALGVLFVVDESDKLVGVITDGDIRRALLQQFSLSDSVESVMNKNFTSLPVEAESSIILEHINNKVKVVPLLDENDTLVDYASINKLRRISVASPLLTGNELAYVTDCIKTNWISSKGKYVKRFEDLFSQYHDGYHALAVSNGTVALHLALLSLNIGNDCEVIVPDLTFAASVNAILYTGARPVLVDVEQDSWNIDVKKAEAFITSKTKAIMVVHLYGNPCDMDSITLLAEKYNLLIVEDCAEALGSYYKGKPVGIFGDVATFSFFGNKTITTGEGGMVIFKNPEAAERAAMLRDHGMKKTRRYWHEEIGYNYRLTNIQAAIGVAQFERLKEFVDAKRKIAKAYTEALSAMPYLQTPVEKAEMINSFWLYTFLVKADAPFNRDQLIQFLQKKSIETRPVFFPMHLMPPYTSFGNSNDLKISQNISNCGISLPSAVNLSEVEIHYICKTILELAKSHELTF